jgi:hypothetical protein
MVICGGKWMLLKTNIFCLMFLRGFLRHDNSICITTRQFHLYYDSSTCNTKNTTSDCTIRMKCMVTCHKATFLIGLKPHRRCNAYRARLEHSRSCVRVPVKQKTVQLVCVASPLSTHN